MNMYKCYCVQITEEQCATLKLPLLLYASIIIILTRGASKIFLTRNKQWRVKHMKARDFPCVTLQEWMLVIELFMCR